MRGKDLLDIIAYVDNDLIEKTSIIEKKKKKITLAKCCTIAACFVLLLSIGIGLIKRDSDVGIDDAGELPMLTVSFEAEGMGFEGYMAYNISELENGNPWTESIQLKTLPVYINTAYTDASGLPVSDLGSEEMKKKAIQIATTLGMEVLSVTYDRVGNMAHSTQIDNDAIYQVTAKTKNAKINVMSNLGINISFNEKIKLPEEYIFTNENNSIEEAEHVTDYLVESFSGLFSFTNPHKALFANYSFSGDLLRSYEVYDKSDDIKESILNYNFKKVSFSPDHNGNLWIIRINNILSCADKIGDYPVITAKEATKLLINNNYITTVPMKMPGKKYIEKVDLIYRTCNTNKIFMPYYRFWVELPDEQQDNGLKMFGTYYVPAVSKQYISNMSMWNGSFN